MHEGESAHQIVKLESSMNTMRDGLLKEVYNLKESVNLLENQTGNVEEWIGWMEEHLDCIQGDI